MTTIQIILLLLFFIILLFFKSFKPNRSKLSEFETKRLITNGDKKIQEIIDRDNALSITSLIFEILSLSLLIVISSIILNGFGLINGILIICLVILMVVFLPKIEIFSRLANRLFGLFEKPTINFFKKRHFLQKFIIQPKTNSININSKEEFRHIIENLPDFIADNDSRKIISSGLLFSQTTIKEIMTPIEEIKFIEKSEFLGPLVLDELHKIGHSKMPVISKNLNQIVGILYLDKLLSLDIKKSMTAEKLMEAKVEYVDDETILRHALVKMLDFGLNILIVKKDGDNIGIVTMRDIVEFLIGQELKLD